MATESKFTIKFAVLVFAVSVVNVFVSASPVDVRQEAPGVAREKRTITVLARGLANIFGLDLENGQSPSGLTNPTTPNPLVITYPPIRVTTQPYQQLNYPTPPTTAPPPEPITYHPVMALPPTTTRLPALRYRGDLNSQNTLPTPRPASLTPKRLITLRPSTLSPTRIITSKPISINTYLETEKAKTHSATLDAKKEVVLIGIPVTIHKVGGLNLGLFNGGKDDGQLKQFQNVYTKSKEKDIESVEQTKKVKENSFKNIEDFGGPVVGVSNVGLVDNYDQYRKRIINKLKTQSSSEISTGNNFELTTSSSPYKYDEFDIPDVASQDVGYHQDSNEFTDKENERETWKFYREETKNIKPAVKHQQENKDSELRGQTVGKDKEGNYEEKKREHDLSAMEYERYKDLMIMKSNGKRKENKDNYQDSEKKQNNVRHESEKYNPSFEENTNLEQQNHNDGQYNVENQVQDKGQQGNEEDVNESYRHKGSNNNNGYRNNPKDSYDSQGHNNDSNREIMEDNVWKHRNVGDRETESQYRGWPQDEDRTQDSKNQYQTSNSERENRDEWKNQKQNEENIGGGSHSDHGEFDYGQYKHDWNHKEEEGSNYKYQNDKRKNPQGSRENFEESVGKQKDSAVENENNHNENHGRGPKKGYKTLKNRIPQSSGEESLEQQRHETYDGPGYGHFPNYQEEQHKNVPKDRLKTPKDEKRNHNPARQQKNNEGVGERPRQVDHISWDYGDPNAGRDSREQGFGDGKTHPDGWKHQGSQEQGHRGHSGVKQNPFNYEQINRHPSHGSLKNGSSQNTDNAEKGKPEIGSGQHPDHRDVFNYEEYTKNHGVHGFQFPSPYQSLQSPPENFWGPTPQSGVHHHGPPLPGAGYPHQLYSYDAPGYFGPFTPPNFPHEGNSFAPAPVFNHHAMAAERPRMDGKGPQRRTGDLKSGRAKTEVDELASDGLSSEMQRDVPARGLRPKKSDTGRNGLTLSGQRVNGGNDVKPQSHPSSVRPRPVLQAIQQIENNRRPQLWPSPFDVATDGSRRVSHTTTSQFQNQNSPLPKSKNLPNLAQSSASQNEQSDAKIQNKSKFDPFNTKPNEKVELKFGWPRSYLKKSASPPRSKTPSGEVQRERSDSPTYTKNSKTSYQADADLYDFGEFNKNTGHYDVQGSSHKSRNQAESRGS